MANDITNIKNIRCLRPYSFRTLSIGPNEWTTDFTHGLSDPLICLVVKIEPHIKITNSYYRPHEAFEFDELFIHFRSEWNGQVIHYQPFLDTYIPEALHILNEKEKDSQSVRCSLIVNPDKGMFYDKLRCGGDFHLKTGNKASKEYHMTFSVRKSEVNRMYKNSLLLTIWLNDINNSFDKNNE